MFPIAGKCRVVPLTAPGSPLRSGYWATRADVVVSQARGHRDMDLAMIPSGTLWEIADGLRDVAEDGRRSPWQAWVDLLDMIVASVPRHDAVFVHAGLLRALGADLQAAASRCEEIPT